MDAENLAILGAGSVRCAIPVILSLATYFGERPIEIRLYDSDEERLDLFDRFARLAFAVHHSTHSLLATTDPAEALDGSHRVIVQLDENCANKLVGRRDDALETATRQLADLIPPEAAVLSLIGPRPDWEAVSWPPELTTADQTSIPHQVLRLINGEEYLYELSKTVTENPIRPWLNRYVVT